MEPSDSIDPFYGDDIVGFFLDPSLFVLILAMGVASAIFAWQKGREPLLWFIYGLLAGPVALVHLTFVATHRGPSPPWMVDD